MPSLRSTLLSVMFSLAMMSPSADDLIGNAPIGFDVEGLSSF